MEAPFIALLFVIILGALIWLWYCISSEFGRIAEEKGFSAQRYRRMCFWLGLIGILMVIALPDRKGNPVSAQQAPASAPAPAATDTPAAAVRSRTEQATEFLGSAARNLKATASAVMAEAARNKPFIPAKEIAADAAPASGTWQCTCRAQNPASSSICSDCRSTWHCACGKVNARNASRCAACKAWYCMCGKVNPASRGSCDVCGAAKPSDAITRKPQLPLPKPKPEPEPVQAGSWRCSCGKTIANAQWRCTTCWAWHCACGAVNPPSRGMCGSCNASKPR